MSVLSRVAKRHMPRSVVNIFRKVQSGLAYRQPQVEPVDPGPDEYWQQEIGGRYDFFRKAFTALQFNSIDGDYAEFGCNGAMTFCMVSKLQSEYPYEIGPFHQWAFDSFQGLPENSTPKDEHPRWIAGQWSTSIDDFHQRCSDRGVPRSRYTVVPGFYETSLDANAAGSRPEKIRLAYIDCDMYSSTQSVLRFLQPRLQHGMILAFDDYYCYSSKLPSGERIAAAEMFANNPQWRLVPYVQFGWHGMSFIVEAINDWMPGGHFQAFA